MKLVSNKILLISPESWGHISVSKHHYARHLAERGNHIVFANPPKDVWSLSNTENSKIQILEYPRFIKALYKFPRFVSQWLIKKKMDQIEKYCNMQFDIIWSFDNSVFFDFTKLRTFNISHIVDLNQNFETERASSTADVCFYTTDLIGHRLKRFNVNSKFINHGFSISKVPPSKVSLPGKNTHKVVYSGNLNMPYLDWKTLNKAVSVCKNVDFIFIGPFHEEMLENNNPTSNHVLDVLNSSHVYTLGKLEASLLPSYYEAASVLIVCYQEAHHSDQSNPHKMMEYLGSGTPVVSTHTATFSSLNAPIIHMCQRNEEFPIVLESCLKNLKDITTQRVKNERKKIALDNTYEKQIERIEQYLKSKSSE